MKEKIQIVKEKAIELWSKLLDKRPESMKKMSAHLIRKTALSWIWKFLRTFIFIGLGFIILYPLLYMISNSFKPLSDYYDPSIVWIPRNLSMDTMVDAFKALNYMQSLKNTAFIGIVTAFIQMLTCMVVGYGFARFKFKGRGILFTLVILTIIVPPQAMSMSLYLQYRFFDFFGLLSLFGLPTVNLLDSYWAFYLPAIFAQGLRAGLYIFIYRQFFRGLPKELEDAALIDGCGPFKTFARVMLPNAGPAILTVFLFSIVWQWNDFYGPAMYMSNKTTIATALGNFRTNLGSVIGSSGASVWDPIQFSSRVQSGCLLAIAPILIVYLFTQKYFVESVERSGIVG